MGQTVKLRDNTCLSTIQTNSTFLAVVDTHIFDGIHTKIVFIYTQHSLQGFYDMIF